MSRARILFVNRFLVQAAFCLRLGGGHIWAALGFLGQQDVQEAFDHIE